MPGKIVRFVNQRIDIKYPPNQGVKDSIQVFAPEGTTFKIRALPFTRWDAPIGVLVTYERVKKPVVDYVLTWVITGTEVDLPEDADPLDPCGDPLHGVLAVYIHRGA